MSAIGALSRKIGQGTYNKCILTPEGHVLRISKAGNCDVVRGAMITRLFQGHSVSLGPSLVREVRNGEMRGKRAFVQALEYLQGGSFPHACTSAEAVALPLLWFLCSARTRFNFTHGDFKCENIVFRNYGQDCEFLFQLHAHGVYRVRAHQVPVIIDFDYASVAQTHDKTAVGTQYTQPPEILASRFLWHIEALNSDQVAAEHDDWWSLGMTLYKWWTVGRNSFRMPDSSYEAYVQSIFDTYLLSRDDESVCNGDWGLIALRNMFRAYCIVKQLGGDISSVTPGCVFFSGERRVFLEQGARQWRRENPVHFSNFQVKLLRRLLSWNPADRSYGGNAWKLITEHFEPVATFCKPDYCCTPQKEEEDAFIPLKLLKDIE